MEDKAVQYMPVERLVCRPQVRQRFDEGTLLEMAQTIKEVGVLQPILARREGSEFVVVDGERRVRSAGMAGRARVPVIVDDRELAEDEVLYRQLVLNCKREELGPIAEARGIQKFIELTGLSAETVARKFGKSPSMLAKMLAVLRLPQAVQEQVQSGALPVTTAYVVSQAPDAESQLELAKQAANGGLKREEVAKRAKANRVRRDPQARPRKESPRRERISIPLGGGRSVAVAGPSLTLPAMIEWLTELLERLRDVQERTADVAEAVKLVASEA